MQALCDLFTFFSIVEMILCPIGIIMGVVWIFNNVL